VLIIGTAKNKTTSGPHSDEPAVID